MKIIFQILILTLVLASCKTKKDIPAQIEKEEQSELLEEKNIPVPELKKMPRDERLRRPKIDPEQIVAQLGLDMAQEEKFLEYWERNQSEMKRLREESKGSDRYLSREKIKEVMERGREEVQSILTPEQFTQYKKILAKDRMNQRRGQ